MSDMLPLNRNWYIQRDLCLVHSELATAIEASVVHSHKAVVPRGSKSCRLSTHPREGSTRSLGKFFVGNSARETRIHCEMVFLEDAFKFSAAVSS